MNKRARLKKRRAARLAASAVAVAAVVGIAAAPASAAPADDITSASQIKEPKLKNGLLSVAGTSANDAITLRLQNGQPGTLLVDIVNDGTAEFSFNRADVKDIEVDAKSGDDSVTIDESNGVFTDNIPTTIDGGSGDDRSSEGPAPRRASAAPGTTRSTASAATTTRAWAPATTRSCGIRATAATSSTARPVPTRWSSTAPTSPRRSTCRRTATGCELFRDVAGITMDTNGVEQVDLNALGGADTSPSTTCGKTEPRRR